MKTHKIHWGTSRNKEKNRKQGKKQKTREKIEGNHKKSKEQIRHKSTQTHKGFTKAHIKKGSKTENKKKKSRKTVQNRKINLDMSLRRNTQDLLGIPRKNWWGKRNKWCVIISANTLRKLTLQRLPKKQWEQKKRGGKEINETHYLRKYINETHYLRTHYLRKYINETHYLSVCQNTRDNVSVFWQTLQSEFPQCICGYTWR